MIEKYFNENRSKKYAAIARFMKCKLWITQEPKLDAQNTRIKSILCLQSACQSSIIL